MYEISSEIVLPFDVLQLTTPNHPSFSLPSRVSTMKPHSMTAQNIRDSSGPNHFDSRNFCTATELPNDLILLLLFVLLFERWWFDVHHLICPITVLARERGFESISYTNYFNSTVQYTNWRQMPIVFVYECWLIPDWIVCLFVVRTVCIVLLTQFLHFVADSTNRVQQKHLFWRVYK